MEILDRTANPEGLSVQNRSGEDDENQDKNPISENVSNSGDHQIPRILAGLISKGNHHHHHNKQPAVCESGRLSVPLLIAPGKGLNISANFSIIFCKSWAAQVPGGFV